jgi:hypothetical protein
VTTTGRPHIVVKVQTASGAYPSSDAGWTNQTLLDPVEASEGAGVALGHAVLEQFLGNLKQPDGTSGGTVAAVGDLGGAWVRLLKADAAGAVTIGSATYTPFWWGTVDEPEVDDDARVKRWTCVGIAGVLANVFIGWGVEVPGAYTAPPNLCYPMEMPRFNALPKGDMSAGTYSIGSGSVRVFDRLNDTATKWTAAAALQHMLAVYGQTLMPPSFSGSGALAWTVNDAVGALGYTVESGLDFNGATLMDAINTFINPRRGLTWRVSVSGTTATIEVCSTLVTAVTVGPYTLPASVRSFDLDLSASLWFRDVRLRASYAAVMDYILVVGAKPRLTMTWAYGTGEHLDKGWTPAAESAWNAYFPSPRTQDVHRRWIIDPDWEGEAYPSGGSLGLRATLSSTTSASYGDGGYTGARSYTPGGAPGTTPAWTLTLDARLCAPSGYNLEAISSLAVEPGETELEPMGFIGSGSLWMPLRMPVRVQQHPPTIEVGSSPADARYLEERLASGAEILATVCVREGQPLCVSWKRATASWARDVPRVLVVRVPGAELWTVLQGTVVGVHDGSGADPDGTLKKTTVDLVIRDDTDTLRGVLALARAWYEEPARSLSYRELGALDITAAGAPGAVAEDVTTINAGVVTVNGVLTRRAWDFREQQQSTAYAFERLIPDLQPLA